MLKNFSSKVKLFKIKKFMDISIRMFGTKTKEDQPNYIKNSFKFRQSKTVSPKIENSEFDTKEFLGQKIFPPIFNEKSEPNDVNKYNDDSNEKIIYNVDQMENKINQDFNNNETYEEKTHEDPRSKNTKNRRVNKEKTRNDENEDYINQNSSNKESAFENLFDLKGNTKKDKDEERENPIKSDKSSNKFEYLYGIHSVEAVLQNNYRIIHELYVLINYKDKPTEIVSKIIKMGKSKNIRIKYLTQGKLDKFTSSRLNEGVVIRCERRTYSNVKKFKQFCEDNIKKNKGNLIVLLDKITDPQNFGSIIRSCVFIGANQIVMNKLHCPPISPAVSKISLGASESIELFNLKFTKNFISDARRDGWKIVATGCEKDQGGSIDENEDRMKVDDNSADEEKTNDNFSNEYIELKDLKLSKDDNVIVILGSESAGVSQNLLKSANYQVFIPPTLNKDLVGKFPFNIVDSLNVAVTGGIIVNHIKFLQKNEAKKELNKKI